MWALAILHLLYNRINQNYVNECDPNCFSKFDFHEMVAYPLKEKNFIIEFTTKITVENRYSKKNQSFYPLH